MRAWAGLAAALALSGAGLGAQAPAEAYLTAPTTRGAFLNGQPLLPGTAILPGETVTTNVGGVVVLTPTSGGGAIELAGGASATVSPVPGGGLALGGGSALVVGPIQVTTPQGERLEPLTSGTSYVVNAAPARTRVGVLAGRLSTISPGRNAAPPQPLVPGHALEISGGAGGALVRLQAIAMNQVRQPPPDAAMPKVVTASQSR
jgi:hypothetical protein